MRILRYLCRLLVKVIEVIKAIITVIYLLFRILLLLLHLFFLIFIHNSFCRFLRKVAKVSKFTTLGFLFSLLDFSRSLIVCSRFSDTTCPVRVFICFSSWFSYLNINLSFIIVAKVIKVTKSIIVAIASSTSIRIITKSTKIIVRFLNFDCIIGSIS